MVAAVDDLRSEPDTTCRHIARVRGKVLHYGCAIAYVGSRTSFIYKNPASIFKYHFHP